MSQFFDMSGACREGIAQRRRSASAANRKSRVRQGARTARGNANNSLPQSFDVAPAADPA